MLKNVAYRSRTLPVVAFSLVMMTVAGCRGSAARPQTDGQNDAAGRYGYAVLDDSAAQFGFRANDTLPEMPLSESPERVRDAVRALIRESRGTFEAQCTRVFQAPDRYLVELRAGCSRDAFLTDSDRPVVVLADGRLMNTFTDRPAYVYRTMCPAFRDDKGVGMGLVKCD